MLQSPIFVNKMNLWEADGNDLSYVLNQLKYVLVRVSSQTRKQVWIIRVRQKILNNLFFVRLDYTFILHVNDKLVKRNNNIILLVLVIKSETWQNAEDHPIFTELRNEDVIKHFMKPTSCFTPRVWIGKSQNTTRIMMLDVVGSVRSSRSQISFCLSVRPLSIFIFLAQISFMSLSWDLS